MRAREQTERGMKERKPSAKEGRREEEQYHATCREYDDLVLVTVMYSHCNLRVAVLSCFLSKWAAERASKRAGAHRSYAVDGRMHLEVPSHSLSSAAGKK